MLGEKIFQYLLSSLAERYAAFGGGQDYTEPPSGFPRRSGPLRMYGVRGSRNEVLAILRRCI